GRGSRTRRPSRRRAAGGGCAGGSSGAWERLLSSTNGRGTGSTTAALPRTIAERGSAYQDLSPGRGATRRRVGGAADGQGGGGKRGGGAGGERRARGGGGGGGGGGVGGGWGGPRCRTRRRPPCGWRTSRPSRSRAGPRGTCAPRRPVPG